MKLGLIQYTGGRTAPFSIEKVGQSRLWAQIPPVEGAAVQPRRWLPEAEANEYRRVPGFQFVRWGQEGDLVQPKRRPRRRGVRPHPRPAPQAASLDELLEQAKGEEEIVKEEGPSVEPPFVMSTSGIVHSRECGYAPKAPTAEFWLQEEAAADGRFTKFHKCLEVDE